MHCHRPNQLYRQEAHRTVPDLGSQHYSLSKENEALFKEDTETIEEPQGEVNPKPTDSRHAPKQAIATFGARMQVTTPMTRQWPPRRQHTINNTTNHHNGDHIQLELVQEEPIKDNLLNSIDTSLEGIHNTIVMNRERRTYLKVASFIPYFSAPYTPKVESITVQTHLLQNSSIKASTYKIR